MPLASPRTWVVGETVTAALMNAEIRDQMNALIADVDYVHKTADESVASSTTLQNDNHLLVSVLANSEYEIIVRIAVNGAASSDFKMAWTLPAGCTGQRFSSGPAVSSATSTADTTTRASGLTNSFGTEINYGVFSTGQLSFVEEILYVVTSGTAGTVQMRWAQNASSATATTVVAGSYIVVRRTA